MTLSDVLEIAGAVMVSLGGAASILFAFSSWLGRVWAERILSKEKAKYAVNLEAFKKELLLESESYKTRLKKSELIFAMELDAASALVALIRDISPTYTHSTMDWYDACNEIALNFGKIELLIGAYLRAHGAVLSESVKDLLSSCYGIAGKNQFEISEGDVSCEANTAADSLHTKLKDAESSMLRQLKTQITT